MTDHHFERFGDLLTDAHLAPATTMAVGGSADRLLEPASAVELAAALAAAAELDLPVTVLGAGSNVLIADAGLRGLVIRLGSAFATIEVVEARKLAHVGAGARNAHAVRAMHRAGLVGAEFLALIPGTFGGAVAMNAGTRWGQTSDVLTSVRVALVSGDVVDLPVAALELSYRHCDLPAGAVVVGGTLALGTGDVTEAAARIKDEKAYRARTQPYKLKCAGSYFANPPGDAAGRLIETAGLKGLVHGEAEVSGLHANFIVNRGGATARACLELMATARAVVGARFDVWLRPEVCLLGFGPGSAADILDRTPLPPRLQALVTAAGEHRT